jgi:hypothetical protein
MPQTVPMSVENIILEVHDRFRPVVRKRKGRRTWTEPMTMPDRVPRLYQAMKGKWGLPRLEGISTAPLLTDDGGIRTADGYDPASGLICAKIPPLSVPEHPSKAEADEALKTLRRAFRTFGFADAPRRVEQMTGTNGETLDVEVVDLEQPAGRDESTLLTALLGAVCRPSLHLAPAVMANAAPLSGSGSGKGLLLCGVSMIAFGVAPWRFTKGGGKRNPEELEKRVSSALLEAHPYLLLENVNNHVLLSETLESVLTDRPCRTRPFGKLEMVELYSTAQIAMTGNGLTPGRDLVRKVIVISLDARTEVPALRKFPLADEAWLAHIKARRGELLNAVLTIWRFGRQQDQAGRLSAGEALGSYAGGAAGVVIRCWHSAARIRSVEFISCARPIRRARTSTRSSGHTRTSKPITRISRGGWRHTRTANPGLERSQIIAIGPAPRPRRQGSSSDRGPLTRPFGGKIGAVEPDRCEASVRFATSSGTSPAGRTPGHRPSAQIRATPSSEARPWRPPRPAAAF